MNIRARLNVALRAPPVISGSSFSRPRSKLEEEKKKKKKGRERERKREKTEEDRRIR